MRTNRLLGLITADRLRLAELSVEAMHPDPAQM